jgi:hypothetical protein
MIMIPLWFGVAIGLACLIAGAMVVSWCDSVDIKDLQDEIERLQRQLRAEYRKNVENK